MQRFVDKLTQYCLKEEIIRSEDVSWFKYSLEKRISTVLVGIPFLILAFVISNFLCAISFFATYFYVRKFVGGYHAKTVWGCLAFSLVLELIFLGGLRNILSTPMIFGIVGVSILVVLKLAPYNHPNMHLSREEIEACRNKGRRRILIASSISVLTCFVGNGEIAKGCTIGIAMAAALLCLGYIYDWRKPCYEE